MANGCHCREVRSRAMSHPPGLSTAQGTDSSPLPWLVCISLPPHRVLAVKQPEDWESSAEFSDPGMAGSQVCCTSELGSGGLEPTLASRVTRACLSGEHYVDVAKLVRQELSSSRPWRQRQPQKKAGTSKGGVNLRGPLYVSQNSTSASLSTCHSKYGSWTSKQLQYPRPPEPDCSSTRSPGGSNEH